MPEIRALVDETRRLTHEIADTPARVEALRPAFAKLLAADNWLPKEYGEPDLKSGMGGGIGQYALYRAEDGSLCLFSLVIPPGSQTPIHDHLAWGLIGVYRGVQDETVYRRRDDGADESRADLEVARRQTVKHGEFYTLLPPLDDIHYVKTVSDTPSISIHLLANDTACVTRHRFDAASWHRHAVPIWIFERKMPERAGLKSGPYVRSFCSLEYSPRRWHRRRQVPSQSGDHKMGGSVMSERPTVWGELPPDGTVLTTAEYLQTAESLRVQELIYGTLRIEESPSFRHQNLLLELAVLMRVFVGQHRLGTVCIAPLDVILDPARALIVQPDLFFVSKSRQPHHHRSGLGRARSGRRSDVAASTHRQGATIASATSRIRRARVLAHSPADREIEVVQLSKHALRRPAHLPWHRGDRIQRPAVTFGSRQTCSAAGDATAHEC